MARRYAPVLCTIWDDPDFQALSIHAQRAYILVLSQRKLSMVGVAPYTPRAWSRGCTTTSVDDIEEAIHELVAARYVIVDTITDELLVRTIVKHDPPKGPKSLAGMWRAWTAVDSPTLRRAILDEMPDDIWTDSTAYPPAAALTLRNAPSDAPCDPPSDGARTRVRASSVLSPPASCHLPPTTDPPSSTAATHANEPFKAVVARLTDRRMEGKEITKNRNGYRATVTANIVADHSDRINELLEKYPTAPVDVIAAAVEGDTHSLRYYTTPQEAS